MKQTLTLILFSLCLNLSAQSVLDSLFNEYVQIEKTKSYLEALSTLEPLLDSIEKAHQIEITKIKNQYEVRLNYINPKGLADWQQRHSNYFYSFFDVKFDEEPTSTGWQAISRDHLKRVFDNRYSAAYARDEETFTGKFLKVLIR